MTEPGSFLNLPDDLLLIALSVDKDRVQDPTRWCAELRAVASATMAGLQTVGESEAMNEWYGHLRDKVVASYREIPGNSEPS